MSRLLYCLFSCFLISFVSCTPIDNGVEGDPEIECAANSITVNFNTRNDFQGHVYVKGRFGEQGCKSDEGGRRVAGIKLGFDQCGTQRSRSLNPKGVFVSNTVVITFHPQFLTKVDRAYTIQCFYMEADKTVSQDLEVSEITTAFQTQTVPMPVCQYDILDGGPDGQPVKFATIGQQLYHKWTCTTETTDIFCAVVHSCFVDDGAGNHQPLLDENGCALDKFLLQNLEYPSDLMAGREAHVFKYADKPALFFQCQVTISIKEPGQQCARPQCGEPGGPSAGAKPAGSPPAAGTPAPAAATPRASPRPGTGGPRASPRPILAGPLAGRGLFLAPLQSLLAGQPGASSVASPRPTSAIIPASTRPPTPQASGAASSAVPSTTAGPRPTSPRPAVVDPLGAEQLNVPSNLGPQPGQEAAGGFDFPDRRRRARSVNTEAIAGTWDLRAQPITALDIDDAIPDDALNRSRNDIRPLETRQQEPGFCLSPITFGLFLAFIIAFSLFTAMVGLLYCLRRSSKH